MAPAQMYPLYLPLYVLFAVWCCWDSRLQSSVNKWLTTCSRTFLEKTEIKVNTFVVMVRDVLSEWCCLSTSLTNWTDAVGGVFSAFFFFSFFLLSCNSPLLLGVLTHGGLVAHQNNFLYLHSGRDNMVQKDLLSSLASTPWTHELCSLCTPYILKYIHALLEISGKNGAINASVFGKLVLLLVVFFCLHWSPLVAIGFNLWNPNNSPMDQKMQPEPTSTNRYKWY